MLVMSRLVIIAALGFAIFLNLVAWYWPNRPKPLSGSWAGEVIHSVSFAPFRRGQSPLTQVLPTPEQIEADLAALRGRALGIRTYTSLEGLMIVPGLAGKYDLTVTMGAWLGPVLKNNEAEIESLIRLANQYPSAIKRVIIGNEVLLRRDLTVDQLIRYIRRVKSAIKQPVSYADVWEFWLKYPQLLQEVDYVTVHFLPYWEDLPVGVDEAPQHIRAVYDRVAEKLPGKPILIGEVGWPSAGRSREGAIPSRWMEAEFINSFLKLAAERGMDYNIVEAFDQPWKVALEGTVGGNWGLLDADRRPKFDLKGPVSEDRDWLIPFVLSTVLTIVTVIWVVRTYPRLGGLGFIGIILLAQILASLVVLCAYTGWRHSYDYLRLSVAISHFILQILFAVTLLHFTLSRLVGFNINSMPVRRVADSLSDLANNWSMFLPLGRGSVSIEKRQRYEIMREIWKREWLILVFAFSAFYQTMMLAIAGRYRDFPTENYTVVAFGLPLAVLVGGVFGQGRLNDYSFGLGSRQGNRNRSGEAWIAYATFILAVILILIEKPTNMEAWGWAFTAVFTTMPFIVSVAEAILNRDGQS